MSVKIRLQRFGRKQRPYYHIVVADARAKRDGRYIEKLGDYNPTVNPAAVSLDVDKAVEWMEKGAQPTDTVKTLLSSKGALYKRHLLKGVRKGALDQAKADKLFLDFITEREQNDQKVIDKVATDRQKAIAKAIAEEAKKRDAKLAPAEEEVTEETASEEAPATETAEETESTTPTEEAAPAEATETKAEEK